MEFIFGPVNSRRFGLSLGINLFPDEKICNFDCLYCELEPAKKQKDVKDPNSVSAIIKELKEALKNYTNIDVLTITANGEPTLYPFLDELIDSLKIFNKKLLILSNASNITKPEVAKALKKLDIVKLSLDCATKKCFKKLDRPIDNSIDKIINSIIKFRKIYKGFLVIEVLVVKGLNDKEEEFLHLKNALKQIKPDRIDLGTIDRPPAYKVEASNFKTLQTLSQILQPLPVHIVAKPNKSNKNYYSKEEILQTLKMRPFNNNDIKLLFDTKSKENLEQLIIENKIKYQKGWYETNTS